MNECNNCGWSLVQKSQKEARWWCPMCEEPRTYEGEPIEASNSDEFDHQVALDELPDEGWNETTAFDALVAAIERHGDLTTTEYGELDDNYPSYSTLKRYVGGSWVEMKNKANEALN